MEPSEALAHPILACADAIETALAEVASVDPAFMTTGDKADALRRLSRLADRLRALQWRVMAAADELAATTADRSVATWVAVETRTEAPAETRDLVLARDLDRRWTRLGAALSAGEVNLAQARVVARALDDLPATEVGSETSAQAEVTLIELAAEHGPRALRRLGRRILEVVAPESCDQHEAAALEREERRAATLTSLSLHRLGDGTTRIAGRLPDSAADRLRTYLEAFTSPRHRDQAHDEGGPPTRRLGHAFAAFLEAVDPSRLPLHGGSATTVIVTIDLERLAGRLEGVGLVGEEPVSATQVRRLACQAQLVPAVLGGRSEVLDLGRGSRLFSAAQRKAMAARDRCCRAEGCTVPAAWCEAHHAGQPWARGGRTDLAEGVLLCSWHHHRAHDPGYQAERLPNGDHRFHRRT